ncbi:MAG: hypothetical protein U0163_08250 [Gemmatimonadaceae bacterium]
MLLVLLAIPSVMPVYGQDSTKAGKPREAKTKPKGPKLRSPPSGPEAIEGKREAEALPLFASNDVLPFTLIANFKQLFRERDTLSTKRFSARLIVRSAAGRTDTVPVQLRTRGHYRLAKCSFAPIRVEFERKSTRGTVFEGQKSLKLGTHCAGGDLSEQYVVREYAAYRVHSIVAPLAFRARLARATYADSATGKDIDTKYAMFVENEDHVAARVQGAVQELRGATFDDLDANDLLSQTLFEYMIGNTDWSIYALHNIRLVQTVDGAFHPVPYDFDFSGLVGTRYAIPDPKLPIKTVRDRLFRGPCRSFDAWGPTLARFKESKARVLAVYDSLPALDKSYARDARDYLADFFRTIERPSDAKAAIVDTCSDKGAA